MTIAVSGASNGDVVSLGVPTGDVFLHASYSAWANAANLVTVRFTNDSGATVDPVSGTFRVCVIRF